MEEKLKYYLYFNDKELGLMCDTDGCWEWIKYYIEEILNVKQFYYDVSLVRGVNLQRVDYGSKDNFFYIVREDYLNEFKEVKK